jgi:predicted permease
MITVLLNSLVPIFAVMGLGYFAGRSGYVDNHHVLQLNVLVMDFALPASLFVATASTSRIGVLFDLRYGLNVPVAGSTLLVSSLASAVTLTIALVLTAGWS